MIQKESMWVDATGAPLQLGDWVVYLIPSMHRLTMGPIMKGTNKSVSVLEISGAKHAATDGGVCAVEYSLFEVGDDGVSHPSTPLIASLAAIHSSTLTSPWFCNAARTHLLAREFSLRCRSFSLHSSVNSSVCCAFSTQRNVLTNC